MMTSRPQQNVTLYRVLPVDEIDHVLLHHHLELYRNFLTGSSSFLTVPNAIIASELPPRPDHPTRFPTPPTIQDSQTGPPRAPSPPPWYYGNPTTQPPFDTIGVQTQVPAPHFDLYDQYYSTSPPPTVPTTSRNPLQALVSPDLSRPPNQSNRYDELLLRSLTPPSVVPLPFPAYFAAPSPPPIPPPEAGQHDAGISESFLPPSIDNPRDPTPPRRRRRRQDLHLPASRSSGNSSLFISPPAPNTPPEHCRACLSGDSSLIYLTCGHPYCRACLNRLVETGLANKASFPPKCCGGRRGGGVDIDAVQIHLNEDVLIRYVSVVEEYSTKNPTYCVNKRCSRLIEQVRIQNSTDKFMTCNECDVQTCKECKQDREQHTGETADQCPKPEELMNEKDKALAETKKWKQCPGCKNLVERTEGCDHMSCECGAEFCYRCGETMVRSNGYICSCVKSRMPARGHPGDLAAGENRFAQARRHRREAMERHRANIRDAEMSLDHVSRTIRSITSADQQHAHHSASNSAQLSPQSSATFGFRPVRPSAGTGKSTTAAINAQLNATKTKLAEIGNFRRIAPARPLVEPPLFQSPYVTPLQPLGPDLRYAGSTTSAISPLHGVGRPYAPSPGRLRSSQPTLPNPITYSTLMQPPTPPVMGRALSFGQYQPRFPQAPTFNGGYSHAWSDTPQTSGFPDPPRISDLMESDHFVPISPPRGSLSANSRSDENHNPFPARIRPRNDDFQHLWS